LKKTRDVGLKFTPDPTKGFECYCDADFAGNWNRHLAPTDPATAKSRSGVIYCKVFEDNSGALELARLPKLRPCTKHINVCYHHFREHVRNGLIKIFPIGTDDQVADTLTKALPQNIFVRHRRALCGI